jgi:hypothetical protein
MQFVTGAKMETLCANNASDIFLGCCLSICLFVFCLYGVVCYTIPVNYLK